MKKITLLVTISIFIFTTIALVACGSKSGSTDNPSNLTANESKINASGELDDSFGINGIVITEIGSIYDDATAIEVQADGRIVVAGESLNNTTNELAIVRYDESGDMDETFGNKGLVIDNLGNSIQTYGLSIQADGKIVIAGCIFNGNDNDIILIRFTSDGFRDPTFGSNGVVQTDSGSNECGYDLAIQSDNKLIVVGFRNYNNDSDFLIARYDPDGSLDQNFGIGGITTTAIPSTMGQFRSGHFKALSIQADGSIVAVGIATIYYQTSSWSQSAIARYTKNGVLDTNFDNKGLILGTACFEWVQDVEIQDDGKIVTIGSNYYSTPREFMLTRLNQDGTLDQSFATDGCARTSIGENYAFSTTLLIQPDNKIIVGGQTRQNNRYCMALARYEMDGSLDLSFNSRGYVISDIGTVSSQTNAIAIQKDNKILAAGNSRSAMSQAFVVIRYNP